MDEKIIDGIIRTMEDKLLDVCNRNRLGAAEACACVTTAVTITLYSILRSTGMNDRKLIHNKIGMILQQAAYSHGDHDYDGK